jgi:hypothetical protein
MRIFETGTITAFPLATGALVVFSSPLSRPDERQQNTKAQLGTKGNGVDKCILFLFHVIKEKESIVAT